MLERVRVPDQADPGFMITTQAPPRASLILYRLKKFFKFAARKSAIQNEKFSQSATKRNSAGVNDTNVRQLPSCTEMVAAPLRSSRTTVRFVAWDCRTAIPRSGSGPSA